MASRKLRIIPPEDREEFDQHCVDMLPALAPEGPIENHLADLIVFDQWRLIRIRGLENEIFAMGSMSAKDQFFAGAETWLAKSKELATLTLYEQRISRVLSRNKTEFEARQSARKAGGAGHTASADSLSTEASLVQPSESQSESVEPQAPVTAPETAVGFVRSSAAAPAIPGAHPPTGAVQIPPTAAGFVRSSATSATIPAPQSPTPAVTAGGFVRSSAATPPHHRPLTPDPHLPIPAQAA